MLRGPAPRLACGVLSLTVLGLLAAGGAASRPDGVWLGLPGVEAAAAVTAGVAILAFSTRVEIGVAAGLLALPLALVMAPRLAALRALTGLPLIALALAVALAALARSSPRPLRCLFVPAVLAVYLTMAARVQARVGPQGDEPHYLMVADSLIRDGDLDLTRDYAEGRYRAFHPEPLEPHFRVRGVQGEIYSIHALGLSLLVLPAYALFGYPGASFFMAGLAALAAREIRALLNDAGIGDGAAWAVAFSPPLVHYAGLVFTEVPAALGLAFALRRARCAGTGSPRAALVWGAVLAFLPWLNVRYALFPILVLLYALAQRPSRIVAVAALSPCVISALALAIYHHALYGLFNPASVYGQRPELALRSLVEGVPGMLLDQEFGLLVYAPLFALSVPGLLALARRCRRDAALVGVLAGAVLITAGSWPMWRGGFNPPARFLVPLAPALGAGLSRGLAAPAALLVGSGRWTGLGGVAFPELIHRDRDGTAPFFRRLSGAQEWTGLLPGFVLAEADRWPLAGLWAGALGLAALLPGRRPSALGLLASAAGLAATAGVAARVGDTRSDGRDALRLLGRPAVAVPGWIFAPAVTATWGPEALAWGPLYEPHRHPDGAVLADRVLVRSGHIEIETDESLTVGEPPRMVVRTETQPPYTERFEMSRKGSRLVADFQVAGAAAPVRLAIEGGSPLLLRGIRLSTFDTARVEHQRQLERP